MTVTGTEQRVYGTLTGGCLINLHRFALVYGSTIESPLESSTTYYADEMPYKQCGYTYKGFITSLFIMEDDTKAIAIIEIRICKNDKRKIVIETYGEIAPDEDISLWFNPGREQHYPTFDDFPTKGVANVTYFDDSNKSYYIWNDTTYEEGSCWEKLDSTTAGSELQGKPTKNTFTFNESKRRNSIIIDCCKKCPDCGCINCSPIVGLLLNNISPSVVYAYGYKHNGDYTAFWKNFNSYVEYKLTCNTVKFWIGDTGYHTIDHHITWEDSILGDTHDLGTLPPGKTPVQESITTEFPYLDYCSWRSMTPVAAYIKVSWFNLTSTTIRIDISNGNYVIYELHPIRLVSYAVVYYWGTPSGYVTPYISGYFPIPVASEDYTIIDLSKCPNTIDIPIATADIFRIPYSITDINGETYGGVIRVSLTGEILSVIKIRSIVTATEMRTRFRLTPTGNIYDYTYGSNGYVPGLPYWLY